MVHRRRLAAPLFTAAVVVLVLAACGGGEAQVPSGPSPRFAAAAAVTPKARDWPMFGVGPGKANVFAGPTGITAGQARTLKRRTIGLPGTVDSSPIFIHAVKVRGRRRDVIVVTTTYGRTVALAASSGKRLWQFVPRGIGRWQGSPQITNTTPVLDRSRAFVFAASPNGVIHKIRLSNGREIRAGRWPVTVTRDATHEKLASSLNLVGNYVIVVTDGYIGDAPPYQGHVLTIDRRTGRIRAIFNTLCSNRRYIQKPSTCGASDSAIWGRAGAVVDLRKHEVYVSTGNGPWNGRTNWGDSTLVLSFPALRLKRNWTPRDESTLNEDDRDLGSTSPALLPNGLALQGGKAGRFDVISRAKPNGTRHFGPRKGGQLQTFKTPGGDLVFTAEAVLGHRVFAATNSGTASYVVTGRHLRHGWHNGTGGTSPVVAGGLVWVYDPSGALNVYVPRTGRRVAHLPADAGHWNSPIVVGGKVWLPEGNANDHATSGRMSVYSVR